MIYVVVKLVAPGINKHKHIYGQDISDTNSQIYLDQILRHFLTNMNISTTTNYKQSNINASSNIEETTAQFKLNSKLEFQLVIK